jgi:hypothetical protein
MTLDKELQMSDELFGGNIPWYVIVMYLEVMVFIGVVLVVFGR